MTTLSRRQLSIASLAALPLVAIRTRAAHAAEFSYKFASNLPAAHPLNVRAGEAAARILEATGGEWSSAFSPTTSSVRIPIL